MALSNACHFLIFQDKLALEEEIWEPIPRCCRLPLGAELSPGQGGACRLMSTGSVYTRVSGEEIAGR